MYAHTHTTLGALRLELCKSPCGFCAPDAGDTIASTLRRSGHPGLLVDGLLVSRRIGPDPKARPYMPQKHPGLRDIYGVDCFGRLHLGPTLGFHPESVLASGFYEILKGVQRGVGKI